MSCVACTGNTRQDVAAPMVGTEAGERVGRAIENLLMGSPVKIDAAGSEGQAQRATLSGVLDLRRGAGRWTLITPTESGTDVIAETVILGDVNYSRIYFSTESPSAFAAFADAAGARRTLDGALTVGGRLTDSLDRVAQMLSEVSFRAFDLGSRSRAGRPADGIRVQFDSADVYDWLSSTGLETLDGARPATGTVTMEFWIADGTLVGLGTGDDGFHDGELLHDVVFEVTYEPVSSVDVTAPT